MRRVRGYDGRRRKEREQRTRPTCERGERRSLRVHSGSGAVAPLTQRAGPLPESQRPPRPDRSCLGQL